MKKTAFLILFICIIYSLSAQKKFEPSLQSFAANYKCPDWFRDAKFGIWAHWGPQSLPGQSDWYGKQLYIQNVYDRKTKTYTGKPHPDYEYHLEHYGHPSKVGYKDILPLWTAEKFDAEALMKLYKRVGAKYFVSMGVHHDNFMLWKSKIHRWNSVEMGPKKDIVGLFQAAAKKEGLHFGVSEHLAASYNWFQTSHGADKTGPLAGVPYDGANPLYEDLYHPKSEPSDTGWLTTSRVNQLDWLKKVDELIDLYHPELLYSDSKLPFDTIGWQMLSHFYNDNIQNNNGKLEAVYNCKLSGPTPMWVNDIERGLMDSISPFPWQTDTSIGPWFYKKKDAKYKSATDIIQMLVDIVSKNGNLLLDVVQTPEGDLEPVVVNILEDIAKWTSVNGEGLYGSRPWKVYGEGPSVSEKKESGPFGGTKDFRSKPYTQADFRFTKKGESIYAFCMAKPSEDIKIVSLAKNSKLIDKRVASVEILGVKEKLTWKQTDGGLVVTKPTELPNSQTIVFKIGFRN